MPSLVMPRVPLVSIVMEAPSPRVAEDTVNLRIFLLHRLTLLHRVIQETTELLLDLERLRGLTYP